MANDGGSQLAAFCAAASFLWLSYTLGRQPLYETPRASSVLLLLISGTATFGASFLSAWLPGPNTRFDDEVASTKASTADLPGRPRRFFMPVVVACIALRIEIFNYVAHNVQCSEAGLEVFLGLGLVAYDLARDRKNRRSVREPDDDMSNTIFDDIGAWILQAWQSSGVILASSCLFVFGAYLALQPASRSSYICLSTDNGPRVRYLQYFSVLLDAVIAITIWRMLTWTRSTKSRLRMLSSVLVSSALLLLLPLLRHGAASSNRPSIYYFDIFVDGMLFAIIFVSSTLYCCDSSPLSLFATIVFIYSLIAAAHKVFLASSFEEVSRFQAVAPIIMLGVGYPMFLYASNTRYVLSIPRSFLVLLLVPVLVTAAIFSLAKNRVLDRHPVNRLVYDARVEVDRWLTRATISKTLDVAVQEYQERNHGRSPPPNFDTWYNFATYRTSPIIDNFAQIESDLWPFWGIKPAKIRHDVSLVSDDPGIGVVIVRSGKASFRKTNVEAHRKMLEGIVDLISIFASSLPDMDVPINLIDRPRVLAPWDDIQRHTKAAKDQKRKLLSRREESEAPGSGISHARVSPLSDFSRQVGLSCPPRAPARAGYYWNVRDFCTSCAAPQSDGQFLKDTELSLDICHQPDIAQIHALYMNHQAQAPYLDLVPIFSAAKTAAFSDILIPMRPPEKKTQEELEAEKRKEPEFRAKKERLVWRGNAGRGYGAVLEPLSRGGHQERLAHLVNNGTSTDKAIMLLPTPGKKNRFTYEHVDVKEINSVLPIDAGITDWAACRGAGCDAAKAELGMAPDLPAPLENRYVLLVDGDEGPSRDVVRVLRSNSLPFVATLFREWHTERLRPWVHYVPVDLRFHGLHSTLAYFSGIRKGWGRVNGRELEMAGGFEDGNWIAEQGQRWAERALRREDMQIYLFRLLLEWGRLTQDDRDEIGFLLEKKD